MWYIHTMENDTAKKNEILPFTTNMDWLGSYYAKWNKEDKERQISYDIRYMWNKNKIKNKIN